MKSSSVRCEQTPTATLPRQRRDEQSRERVHRRSSCPPRPRRFESGPCGCTCPGVCFCPVGCLPFACSDRCWKVRLCWTYTAGWVELAIGKGQKAMGKGPQIAGRWGDGKTRKREGGMH